ncbi:DUF1127 domain-containing protein [Salipiger abyssi]|uniref:Putative DUF1127 protein n=1 Tax=Salipiger abyssi TaxID=1250539 RepID=A0A1P8UW92_9RHOB|nr:DUF1127 domain-containing protein [Salipiger abyssi]APZ53662.1 putative DUF1127 protein [Salipiger abyssi]
MTRDIALTGCPAKSRRRIPLLTRLLDLDALWRQRRQLARLDEAALRDMGLTRAEALHEARRSLWDAPAHWRQ